MPKKHTDDRCVCVNKGHRKLVKKGMCCACRQKTEFNENAISGASEQTQLVTNSNSVCVGVRSAP